MRRKNRIGLGLLGVALAGMLLLSGCFTMHSEIAINSDGSGTQTVILAVSKEMMALASQNGESTSESGAPAENQDPLADAQAELKTLSDKIPGASFEPYKDAAGKEGFKVVLPFSSLDELAKLQLGDKPDDSMDRLLSRRAAA